MFIKVHICLFLLNTKYICFSFIVLKSSKEIFRAFILDFPFEEIRENYFFHSNQNLIIYFLENYQQIENKAIELQKEVISLRGRETNVLVIREQVWLHKAELVKILIKNKLQKRIGVFARDLHVQLISKELAADFLNQYHPLGFTNSRIYLGVYIPKHRAFRFQKNDLPELIAVATFGKNITRKKVGVEGQKSLEWIRLATLPTIRMVGGISKIFHFLHSVEAFDDIMTYVDIEWNDAKGLLNMGFVLEEITLPINLGKEFNLGNYKLRYVKS